MLPNIKCTLHKDEVIVLLDISQKPSRKNRSYCFECMHQVHIEKTIQIKKIPEQATQHCNKITKQISEEFHLWINKINQTIQALNTLKDKTTKTLDDMIKKCKTQLNEYENNMKLEQESYKNIIKDMTIDKLELIGEILSGNHNRESQLELNKNSSQVLGGELSTSLNQLLSDELEAAADIREMFLDQIIIQSSSKQKKGCYALACNQKHNLIAGGSGKNIIIWELKKFQLEEISLLKGHTDIITAIVIYSSGDLIVSGGAQNDKSIKLWSKQEGQWNCKQNLNHHLGRITDLQLTKNQEQLVSASVDKLIKIWKLKSPDYQLECIQTLNNDNHVFWITISQDSLFIISSSSEASLNLYKNEFTEISPWKKLKKIETKGKINRVYFTNTDELLVQQVNPPQLIVYTKNQNNQFSAIQQVSLNQPDDSNILFPVFQINNKIYLKNEQFVYIINRLRTGKYFIQQILSGLCNSGCISSSGEGIILRNSENKSINIYK